MSPRPSHASRPATNRLRPLLEALEPREVPAALIVLDLNGISRSEIEYLTPRVTTNRDLANLPSRPGFERVKSFVGEFATLQTLDGGYTRFRFLDFDRNGVLDARDGELAAERLMARVREDYAPYDIQVVREDDTRRAVDRLRASTRHDALIHLAGDDEVYGPGGQAPLDPGNVRDDAGSAGHTIGVARGVAGFAATDDEKAAMFINFLANAVSHEAGHTFGLDHLAEYELPAYGTSMMTESIGYQNLTFADVTYDLWRGTQNEHQYLTRVLGTSARPWAAVLKPGQLTITGSNVADTVHVLEAGADDWVVRISTSPLGVNDSYRVDSTGTPDAFSLNPFPMPIQVIQFQGRSGNDYLWVQGAPDSSTGIEVPVKAYGGPGNDTMYGAASADLLVGEAGDDKLYGQWHHDHLRGGDGRDVLVGAHGNDKLLGGNNRDVLIGGPDSDLLYGNDWGPVLTITDDADLLISGSTAFDRNETALAALQAEWVSARDYATRVANLRGLGTGLRANGSFFLVPTGAGATVFDDGVADSLFGNGSRDWFVANLVEVGGPIDTIGDRVIGGTLDERVLELVVRR